MKICLNCGDKLLDAAKKCPTCGTKDKGFPIVNSNDKEQIQQIISSVPNPKSGLEAKWQVNLATKDMSLKDAIKYRVGGDSRKQVLESQMETERLKQLDKDGIPYCPKCHSTSLTAHKKGFGIGKAMIGGTVAGPIGLIAGNINAKKVRVTCLKCGHQFWAGQK
jgi:RNA polymerase subunit RPABC4/transcription elongation factor Spt4